MKVLFLLILSISAFADSGNQTISSFSKAKKFAAKIHEENPFTLYCNCKFHGKTIDLGSCGYQVHKNLRRAKSLEWEHVVAAESFGQSFMEWREGSEKCVKKGKRFKGRKCAGKNAEFSRMEADLYNLWPEVGELNGLRSNYSMAALGGPEKTKGITFGACKALVADRKFEPMDFAKGIVARVHFYMDKNYPARGVISEKNRKLFEAWDKMFPVTSWECKRAEKIRRIQGNENTVLTERCKAEKK